MIKNPFDHMTLDEYNARLDEAIVMATKGEPWYEPSEWELRDQIPVDIGAGRARHWFED